MFKRLTTLVIALFLLSPGGHKLAAQAPPEPDANMDQPYNPNAQYDPGQQSYQSQSYPQQSYPQQSYAAPQAYPQQPAYTVSQALTPDQLQQLVAPIALYPDQLIALILAASTYPAQVAEADNWRQAQGNASPDQIAAGANIQSWDPSIKGLTAFPQVLTQLDANLSWTTALGNAYYNQPQDVLQTIQILRQHASAAGTLQSTPQQLVTYNQGYIQLVPANPEVVYVPAYNPWTVYGQPVSPYPGFSLFGALGSFLDSSTLQFGLGMAMSAFSQTPWGWLGWGLNWLTQNILFNQSNYYSNSTSVSDWGLPQGGPRAFTAQRYYAHNSLTYGGYNSAQPYRSQSPYGWSHENYNRGYQSPVFGNNRPPLQTPLQSRASLQSWNRTPAPARPQLYTQPYNHPVFNSRFNERYPAGYAARPGQSYTGSLQAYNRNPLPIARPQTYSQSYSRPAYGSGFYNAAPSYRAPSSTLQRNDYGTRSVFTGNGFMNSSVKPQRSGGFHLFGSVHTSDNSYGGHAFKEPSFKQPKFKEPKNFGGGHGFHSFGGGHSSGGHFGGHFGGGGHHRL